ncbi:DUF5872 domain-containing protein [Adhaeribacter radiodurans]|uniref:DUF5872 domain-containing protein n=1 Tax=Adhaeribacter radiodurans TaxID=2745197 RepID=A0A7L7L9W0_9BACT|nr:DUF5872 domain-containing protein [Adhaeribacter radiodurans]QMU29325.1 hypothetical protein HUW48_15355 [Adhaeribacter radiodurans]
MAKNRNEQQYTQPELREKIKEELKQSHKGGKKGQWSARKSQLLAKEYEEKGGGYKGKKDEQAKALDQWTKEEWQTQKGEPNARQKDKTSRYLPKEVWDKLSPEEKKEAEQTKAKGSKKGEQQVSYTPAIKIALKKVKSKDTGITRKDLLEEAKKLNIKGRTKMKKQELEQAIQAHK